MLEIRNATLCVAGRLLLENAQARLARGDKAALVGRNGTGKSTLLRLIASGAGGDSGEVVLAAGTRVGTVAQEPPPPGQSLLTAVLAADSERTALLAEAETATDPARIAAVHERLAAIDSHTAEARAATILSGLGFDVPAQARDVGAFSGGWRMRVALAAALFARPDLLLLDEPTNHLDLEAAVWLQDWLAQWPGTLLLVSHDRTLLNAVPRRILHLHDRRLTAYTGNYDTFERQRRETAAHQARQAARQQAERARIQGFVDRFRAKATKARQAQSRLKMLERMDPIPVEAEESAISFDLPTPTPLPPPLVTLDQAQVGYDPATPVLKRVSLRLDPDDRVALLGANGNGKTTLARLLAGRLAPLGGTLTTPPRLVSGYFAQDQAEELDLNATPLAHMARALPDAPPQTLRSHLGRFSFTQSQQDTPVGHLSGGERARLLLALVTREAPHLLILDEPTNHLDIAAREALVQALNAFEGAVVLISHDPHMVELVADRLWLVADGGVQAFEGDLEDYRRHLLEERRRQRQADSGAEDSARASRRDQRRAAADQRARTAPLRKTLKDAERTVERLTTERQRLETALADPGLYASGDGQALATLQKELGTVEKALAEAEEAWLAAADALEQAGEP